MSYFNFFFKTGKVKRYNLPLPSGVDREVNGCFLIFLVGAQTQLTYPRSRFSRSSWVSSLPLFTLRSNNNACTSVLTPKLHSTNSCVGCDDLLPFHPQIPQDLLHLEGLVDPAAEDKTGNELFVPRKCTAESSKFRFHWTPNGLLLISGLMVVYINHTYVSSTWTLRTSRTRGTRRALQKERPCWDEIKEFMKVFIKRATVSHHGANVTILSLLTRRSRKSLKMPTRNQVGFQEIITRHNRILNISTIWILMIKCVLLTSRSCFRLSHWCSEILNIAVGQTLNNWIN